MIIQNPLFEGLKPVSFTSSNALEDWETFKQKIEWIFDGMDTKSLPSKRKIGILMSKAGDEAVQIYQTLSLPVDSTYDDVIEAFDNYVQLKKNTVFERNVFFKLAQKSDQSIDGYVLQLKHQARKNEFHTAEQENLIQDRLVLGIQDSFLQKELLRDPKLNLKKAVDMCKIWERASFEAQALNCQLNNESSMSVDKLSSIGLREKNVSFPLFARQIEIRIRVILVVLQVNVGIVATFTNKTHALLLVKNVTFVILWVISQRYAVRNWPPKIRS